MKENINKARGNTSSLLLPPHKLIKQAVNQKLLLTLYWQYTQNFLRISKINFVLLLEIIKSSQHTVGGHQSFSSIMEKRTHPLDINANPMILFKSISYQLLHIGEFFQLPTTPWNFLWLFRHIHCYPTVLSTDSHILSTVLHFCLLID